MALPQGLNFVFNVPQISHFGLKLNLSLRDVLADLISDSF